nr:MAG TPA: hypothetical protein [Caudoviricetes sp.]
MQPNPYQSMNYNIQPAYQQYGYNPYFQQPRMQQPQIEPLQTTNQFQQQLQSGINGRVVQSVEMITANDVPMDGSAAFFPMQDMSAILAKSWNADGTIKTVIFKPINETVPQNEIHNKENLKIDLSDGTVSAFMDRFDELSERLEQLEVSINKTAPKSSAQSTKRKADAE